MDSNEVAKRIAKEAAKYEGDDSVVFTLALMTALDEGEELDSAVAVAHEAMKGDE